MQRTEDWTDELRQALRTAEDLAAAELIPKNAVDNYRPVIEKYRLLLPRYYASLIDKGDPACPIRLQAIPSPCELTNRLPESKRDPLSDLAFKPASRMTTRYQDRALLQLTPSCPMYCRFCFRKGLLTGHEESLFDGSLEDAIAYIERHTELEEIILSGGDPLMVHDSELSAVLTQLENISHLRRVRIHTRVPVTLPNRITEALAQILSATRFPLVLVTHFNHPKELTVQSTLACKRLRAQGLSLFNQSVLLKGVNDRVETLCLLSKGLFEIGVIPYYLHHPDPASGTEHFLVPAAEGLRIFESLRQMLPGYLTPRYVIDIVGSPYKVPVTER
ncbi:MAG: KamA family radical SAM protein [Deltaproteobacteria bacterium]|nr:KamA family radical SAM protein [Deltaproteobacteria bacterium]